MRRPTPFARNMYWILGGPGGRTPVACGGSDPAMRWARWFEAATRNSGENFDPAKPTRRVAATTTASGAWVSTVFLGLDHRYFGEGPPLLFETMAFAGDDFDSYQARYSTWADAEAGHVLAVAAIEALERQGRDALSALFTRKPADTPA